jgi:hypothetical protein
MSTAVGDVPELGDIDVDHRTGMVVFIAANHLPRPDIDMTEFVEPAPSKDRVNG